MAGPSVIEGQGIIDPRRLAPAPRFGTQGRHGTASKSRFVRPLSDFPTASDSLALPEAVVPAEPLLRARVVRQQE